MAVRKEGNKMFHHISCFPLVKVHPWETKSLPLQVASFDTLHCCLTIDTLLVPDPMPHNPLFHPPSRNGGRLEIPGIVLVELACALRMSD